MCHSKHSNFLEWNLFFLGKYINEANIKELITKQEEEKHFSFRDFSTTPKSAKAILDLDISNLHIFCNNQSNHSQTPFFNWKLLANHKFFLKGIPI